MRNADIKRKTDETDIRLTLEIDGTGRSDIKSGVGFMDHMLELFTRHGGFDLALECRGDTHVDDHHSVEDIGIVLGEAFRTALGDRRGIARYADRTVPMDESLILAAVDISGRGALYFDARMPSQKVGTFDTELVKEFFTAFAVNAGITLHIREIAGENTHHTIEGMFKAVSRALRDACSVDPRFSDVIPSTKGVL